MLKNNSIIIQVKNYVGSTIEYKKRWRKYHDEAGKNVTLYWAIEEQERGNFSFVVIKIIEWIESELLLINELESCHIEKYDSINNEWDTKYSLDMLKLY